MHCRSVVILISFLTFICFNKTLAKDFENIQNQYHHLEQHLINKSIDKETYLFKVDSLTLALQYTGETFSIQELKSLLARFHTLAFSKKDYKDYRPKYFYYFMNNADILGKSGEAIFFANKYEEQLIENGDSDIIVASFYKVVFYSANKNHEKVIEIYHQKKDYLESLKDSVFVKSQRDAKLVQAIQFIAKVGEAFKATNNIVEAQQKNTLANDIYNTFKEVNNVKEGPLTLSQLIINFSNIELLLHEKKYSHAKTILDETDSILKNKSSLLRFFQNPYKTYLISLWVEFYLENGDISLAEEYINQFEDEQYNYQDYESMLNNFKSRLYGLQKNYKKANEYLGNNLEHSKEQFIHISNEMTDLLEAYTEVEYNRQMLQIAEHSKKRRLYWIIIISLLSFSIIFGLVYFIIKTKRATQKRIEKLNKLTELQIKTATQQSEQKAKTRFAQDLHDNYSTTIASIALRFEELAKSSQQPEEVLELEELKNILENVYQSIRGQSHELFGLSNNTEHAAFKSSVEKMMEVALPTNKFTKELDVDEKVIEQLSLNKQIELIRIIQTSLSNIAMHAKNASEAFIFIYKNKNQLHLEIGDNGKNKIHTHSILEKNSGLGLKSIAKRVREMNGQFNISNKHGFQVNINIPLTA